MEQTHDLSSATHSTASREMSLSSIGGDDGGSDGGYDDDDDGGDDDDDDEDDCWSLTSVFNHFDLLFVNCHSFRVMARSRHF